MSLVFFPPIPTLVASGWLFLTSLSFFFLETQGDYLFFCLWSAKDDQLQNRTLSSSWGAETPFLPNPSTSLFSLILAFDSLVP